LATNGVCVVICLQKWPIGLLLPQKMSAFGLFYRQKLSANYLRRGGFTARNGIHTIAAALQPGCVLE
jgi:hypothetical protein